MTRFLPFLLVVLLAVPGMADEKIAAKLHGVWEGGPCIGSLTIKPDGTFERAGYSPGNNRLGGTWKLTWEALPPTIVMDCVDSDDKERIGQPHAAKVIELTDGHLGLLYLAADTKWPEKLDSSKGESLTRYHRPGKDD